MDVHGEALAQDIALGVVAEEAGGATAKQREEATDLSSRSDLTVDRMTVREDYKAAERDLLELFKNIQRCD
jgi:hypothetical protein